MSAGKINLKPVILFIALTLIGCNGKTKEALYSEGVKELGKANLSGALVLFKSALEKDSNYQDARYQLAKTYFASEKYELAEKEFEKVARQNPSRTDIPLDLARINLIQKKPDLVLQEIDRLKLDSAEALEIKGSAYVLKNRLSDAEACFLKALKDKPDRTSARIQLAAIYRQLGRNADTRRMLDEAIKTDPKNFRAYYMLADLELAEGRKDKALDIYAKAAELNPSDPSALYKQGLLYIEKREIDKAEKIAADLEKRFPRHADGTRLQGMANFHSQKYKDAVLFLQKSIAIRPNQEAYYYLGLCYYNQNELELALSQFRTVLDVNPSAPQARLLTGIILLKQKRIDDSIAEIRKLLQAEPRFALAHNILGSAYMAKGLYDEGMKELNRALELDPKIVDVHMKKGIFHFSKGQFKEAENDLQSAVHVAPELLNSRLLLASYYIRQKNDEKAVTLLTQGISGKKSDAIIYNNLAAVMFARNNIAEGRNYLLKAKKADPDYLNAYFNLATVFLATNEHEKALQEYREILQRDAKNAKALLSMAALLEFKGEESQAYKLYQQATETKSADAYLALANYHVKRKEYKKAHSVLDDAIEQISRNIAALDMKARLYVSGKKYKEALRVYNEISAFNTDLGVHHKISVYLLMKDIPKAHEEARRYILLNPNLAYGYLLEAAIYQKQNELDPAMEALKNGVRVEPRSTPALLELGNLYVKKNDRKSAMDAYEKALRLDKDFLPALFAQAVLIETGGNKKAAVQRYREILVKSDTFMPAINNLAYIYINDAEMGSLQEGLRLAFSGFRLAPENPATLDTLGYALIKNGRSNDAVKLLEKAKILMPDDATIAEHLAMAHAAQKVKAVPEKKAR